MILTEKVDVKIYSKNINYYKKLGYVNLHNNDIITINISELSIGSHILVDVKCDICGKEKKITFQKYLHNYKRQGYYTCSQKCGNNKREITCLYKYGENFISKTDFSKNKIKETCIEKYGVENTFQSEMIKDKIKKICLERYGNNSPMRNKDIINKGLNVKIDRGSIFSIKTDEFSNYKRIIRNLTASVEKKLYKNWDGLDYYYGEYIKEYGNLPHNNPLYPTIDHKISIMYGYINKVPPEIIGSFDNLCITKRKINSSKNHKTEMEFKRCKAIL